MRIIRHYFLDLEGTIVKDKDYLPVEGAVEWVNGLKAAGKQVLVASNNTTHPAVEIRRRLTEQGFKIEENEILTCVGVGMEVLSEQGIRSCFVIGEDPLRGMLAEAGVEITQGKDAQAVLVGLDRELTYAKLSGAVETLLESQGPLIALHTNRLYLDVGGVRAPSVGAVVRALEYACGVEAVVVGKPSERYYQSALKRCSANPQEVIFVSDDPFSDLAGANRAGMRTAFVLSGKYPSPDVLESMEPEMRPDIVASSVREIEVGA